MGWNEKSRAAPGKAETSGAALRIEFGIVLALVVLALGAGLYSLFT